MWWYWASVCGWLSSCLSWKFGTLAGLESCRCWSYLDPKGQRVRWHRLKVNTIKLILVRKGKKHTLKKLKIRQRKWFGYLLQHQPWRQIRPINFFIQGMTRGLEVNWLKTMMQALGNIRDILPSVTVLEQEVSTVEEFVYLGALIHSSTHSSPDILRRSALLLLLNECYYSVIKFKKNTLKRTLYS